jgi:ribosomal protein S18 acetylase RimI-like enzyme
MERPPPITVERLSPTTRGDYLALFDHEHGPAFADNPEWARCYCQFYRTPRALDWQAFTASENRIAAAAAIDCGEAEGYLAKAEGTIPPDAREASLPPEGGRALGTAHEARSSVVGWMHAAPRHKLPHCFERMKIAPLPVDVAPHEAAVIVCFVIAPAWRRRGVASALLDFALADFAARGITVVDAFPFKSGASTDATDHYHGPASLFASRGFVPVADHPDLTVVRKQLVPGVGTSSSP